MDFTNLFDAYSRRARLAPALFVLLPPLVCIALWVPSVYALGVGLLSLVVACGLLFLLANIARHRGHKAQERLYREWGGMPSTAMLRFRDNELDDVTKERYHVFFSENISDLRMPTQNSEHSDPVAADQHYASACKWLLEQTRDTATFDLLFKENIEYGFRRNLRGLKLLGVLFAVLSVAGSLGGHYLLYRVGSPILSAPSTVATAVSFVALALWVFVVDDDWVHGAAKSYAIRVLASCDRLAT